MKKFVKNRAGAASPAEKNGALTKRVGLVACLGAAGLLTGCGGFNQALSFDKAIAVKIPRTKSGEPADQWSSRDRTWDFKFIARTTANEKDQPESDWYLARRTNEPQRRLSAKEHWAYTEKNMVPLAEAVHDRLHVYPVAMEPNQVFDVKKEENPPALEELTDGRRPATLKVTAPSRFWPAFRTSTGAIDPLAHLDEKHTQLHAAQKVVEAKRLREGADRVRIGILDTGFTANHLTAPRYLENRKEADAYARFSRQTLIPPGNAPRASHGTGTIGLLAGREINIDGCAKLSGCQSAPLGAAPNAYVVPVRIAPNVFSLATSNLAWGIDYASRQRGCDVISMSHGGAASLVWVDAVNAAYERGTAVFTATGNFFSVTGTRGLLVPSTPVFPAAFYHVVGVTGVTPGEKTYAKNPLTRLAGGLLHGTSGIGTYFMRGCYGGDGSARLFYKENKGSPRLRNNPLAGYTPNAPWADFSGRDRLKLDGAGTSSAAPQVAGAGALWLQYNRKDIERDAAWHSWKKAEAVYTALIDQADRPKRDEPDPYLGAGKVKALNALSVPYQGIESRFPERVDGKQAPLFFRHVNPEHLDGRKTLSGLLVGLTHGYVPTKERLQLHQDRRQASEREPAIQQLYFNYLLLHQWHKGRTPRKVQDAQFHAQANELARKALAGS